MLSASTPQREICAQLHIGRGVLNRYKKLADEAKVDYGTIGRMSEGQIHSLLQSPPTPKPSEQKNELKELLPDYAGGTLAKTPPPDHTVVTRGISQGSS